MRRDPTPLPTRRVEAAPARRNLAEKNQKKLNSGSGSDNVFHFDGERGR
jgi:hypothetical protein